MTRLWPEGKAVKVREEEAPTSFVWQGKTHHIAEVCNRWRVHTRWWQPEGVLWREYVKVTTEAGLLCLLYWDLLNGGLVLSSSKGWFLARVYD